MASLRDALKSAFSEAGLEIPAKQTSAAVQRSKAPIAPARPVHQVQQRAEGRLQDQRRKTNSPVSSKVVQAAVLARQHSRPSQAVPPVIPPPVLDCVLTLGPNARYILKSDGELNLRLLPNSEASGASEQCHVGVLRDQRELVMGLDFGTSSVKVVIGDAALDKSFLVPFLGGTGLSSYLLPSRLYQTADFFSLESGDVCHRDLKLAFIADPSNIENQVRVVAFLAAVMIRARGWLFCDHRSAYKNTEIIWKVSIGLPAANSMSNELAQVLQRLASIAWKCAASPDSLTRIEITKLLETKQTAEIGTVEIDVVPEIAAQIYGFVVSNSFDKRAANIYLMVDVGAGTVDSSLFHVKPAKGGKWDFEFFTTAVEPNGVMNLHRYRNTWWQDILKKNSAPQSLLHDVQEGWRDTDHLTAIPEHFDEYLEGVRLSFRPGVESPDKAFFMGRVLTQVRGKTLWRAWRDKYLDQQSIAGLPFFLCGGGARMNYYLELESQLQQQPGFTWLKADAWTMGVPGDLVANGLSDEDYDRVSVAYGLSRLDVGKVVRAAPLPKVLIEPATSWRNNYIDKDSC
jgi:hypothetical protein